MSFSFFKQSRPKSPQELAKAIKDSLVALDSKTVAEVKALEKALEEVEKNISSMRNMLSGDGEIEPSADQIAQLTLEISDDDVISLLFHKLPILGWETRKNIVYCWSILLKQKVDSTFCCVRYLENHLELLDFLVACYDNKEIALTCGHMLRECIKIPSYQLLQNTYWRLPVLSYSSNLLSYLILMLPLMHSQHLRICLLNTQL